VGLILQNQTCFSPYGASVCSINTYGLDQNQEKIIVNSIAWVSKRWWQWWQKRKALMTEESNRAMDGRKIDRWQKERGNGGKNFISFFVLFLFYP
jgi:hypothetical protein